MKSRIFLILLIFAVSCNEGKPTGEPGPADEKTPEAVLESSVNCYEWTGNNDTIKVRLELNGSDVSGTIIYDYFQKDRNEGALKGKLNGDVIIADYSFDSEGTRSVRQVAFKKAGNDIIEGFGSMEEINGKMSFTNPDSLIFNPSFIIPPVDCRP